MGVSPSLPKPPNLRNWDEPARRFWAQGGVPEYWLLDPERQQAEFYLRGNDGIYRVMPLGNDGLYRSQVLAGLWLKVEWLWQPLPPPIMDVLREWKLL